MSPNPNPYYVTADNGVSQGPIYLRGGVQGAWEEEEDGYTVLPDKKGNYFYARQDAATGELVATTLPIRKKVNGVLVGASPRKYGIPRHVRPSEEAQMRKCGDFCEKDHGQGDRRLRNLVSTTGTLKNLIVLFKFKDHTTRTLPTAADITALMNHPGDGVNTAYNLLAPTGSVRFVSLCFL
jgi:hypothetical protein